MRIIVPIKQVPESSAVKMDPETGTIVRDGGEAVVNPLDLYAVEAALQLRERHGGEVDVISMGPKRAESAIREVLAMGCDDGYLLSDKKFGGADTWATSYVLSEAIRTMGKFDLIITGERATDGDTGQVGPGIAAWLNIPCATYVSRISVSEADDGETERSADVDRLIEAGYQQIRMCLPALITVVKEIAVPRLPTLAGKKSAQQADVRLLTRDTLDLDPARLGTRGSPTRVVRIASPTVARFGRKVDGRKESTEAVSELAAFITEQGFGPGGAS